MTKANLLIVDPEARRRRLLEVGLRRAGYRVTVAGDPEQALWFLERSPPDMIVASFRFEKASGLDLVQSLRGRPEWTQVGLIFVVADPVEETEAGPHADATIREPAFLREVTTRVDQALWRRQIGALARGLRRSIRGEVGLVAVADLLGLVERLGATGALELELPGKAGIVWFRDGAVLDASLGPFEGEEAVFRLLGADSGTFELSFKPIAHAALITTPTSTLVMEGLRRLDEWMRLCEEMPPLSTVLRVNHEALALRRKDLPAEQLVLVQRCDGRRSIQDVIDGGGQDSLLALEALRSLRGGGVLVEVASSSAPALTSPADSLVELPPLPQPFPSFAEGSGADTELVSGIPDEPAVADAVTSALGGVAPALTSAPAPASMPIAQSAQAEGAEELASAPAPSARRPGSALFPPVPLPVGVRLPRVRALSARASSGPVAQIPALTRLPTRSPQATPGVGELTRVAGSLVSEASPRRADEELRFTERLQQPTILVHRAERAGVPPVERVETVARRRETSATGVSAAGELTVSGGWSGIRGPREAADVWPDDAQPLVPASAEDMSRLSALASAIGGGPNSAPAASQARLSVPQPVPEAPPSRVLTVVVVIALVVGGLLFAAHLVEIEAPGAVAVTTPAPELAGPATSPTAGALAQATKKKEEEAAAAREAAKKDRAAAAAAIVVEAEALYDQGKLGEASLEVARALARDPRSPAALVLRAKIWLDQKAPGRAREALKLALEEDPRHAEAYVTLGVLEEAEGRRAEAIAAYERYLELAPEARYATSVRRQLVTLRRRKK